MVRNTFKEDKEAFFATFMTRWGWMSFILGNLLYGYLIINYLYDVDNFIKSYLQSLPSFLISPVSWILLGIISSVASFLLLFIVEKIVLLTGIRNKRIFK